MLRALRTLVRLPVALRTVSAALLAIPPASIAVHATDASSKPKAVAYFAGGCYWGVEEVYEHTRGVKSATSGFVTPARLDASSPDDPAARGYAEAVRVEYDSTQVSYGQLLEIFFNVAHDPTQVGRQGPDVGPEYRSLVIVLDDAQRAAARSYIATLERGKVFPRPITTEIVALGKFKEAPEGQQDYAARHPTDRYIVINDVPKVVALKQQYAALYR